MKKINIKQLLSLILITATLVCSVACTPSTQTPDTPSDVTSAPEEGALTNAPAETTEAPVETEAPDTKITLFEEDKWSYRLVTRSQRSQYEIDFSSALSQAMCSITGKTPHTANDIAIKGDDVLEIIIGYTAHPVMKTMYYDLGYGQAKACVVGNKILLASYTKEGYDMLLEHVKKVLSDAYSNGKIELYASKINTVINANEKLHNVFCIDGLEFTSIEDCGLDQTLIIHKNASEKIFEEYIKKYSAYKCVSEVYDSGNCFATFDVGKDLINVSFSNGDKCLRIIHNKNTAPSSLLNGQGEVNKVCEPMIIMHGLGWKQSGYTSHENGLCLIFRLSDGRFIVVDGGFNREKDADDLYKLLKNNTPSGMDTVIAAWFITHAHGDHHATFTSVFTKYRSSVKVENVIFNPPLGGVYSSDKDEGGGWVTLISTIPAYRANYIRPHVGDRYYIGDAVIDMLYTVDYQYPQVFSYYNTSSLIFSVKLAGQRIMVTGDGANTSFDKIVKMYGENLKCDIVQVAHHGYGTGTSASASTAIIQGYRYMSPSLVLWPIGKSGYNSVQNAVYNVALKTLPSVKKIIVAEDKDHTVMLPFKAS